MLLLLREHRKNQLQNFYWKSILVLIAMAKIHLIRCEFLQEVWCTPLVNAKIAYCFLRLSKKVWHGPSETELTQSFQCWQRQLHSIANSASAEEAHLKYNLWLTNMIDMAHCRNFECTCQKCSSTASIKDLCHCKASDTYCMNSDHKVAASMPESSDLQS